MPTVPASPCAIGIDFGTGSARTLVLDLSTGEEVAVYEAAYTHGVIDQILPESGEPLPPDWALQDPDDYLDALSRGIMAVLAGRPEIAANVIGIGIDFTSCTVLPATVGGVPLCRVPQWRAHPHAWPKLWKHHAAQDVADRLNEVALDRDEAFLSRYGGRISSEWYFPKLIELWLEDGDVYDAASHFIEATDWVVWQLTGRPCRSACAAAYKALWSPADGLPSREFFEAAYPGFSRPGEKLGTIFAPLGAAAGVLTESLARQFGLPDAVAVAVGNIDSFVSFPGAGADGPGTYVMVVGTSICDMVVHPEERRLAGITGVAPDGIVPGLYGYEAGQPAVGDMLAWFANFVARPSSGGGTGSGLLAELEKEATSVRPGQTGLVALDWWNGNRSVLADADLSGAVLGLTLQTTPVEVYRCLLESIAFGNKAIVENFSQAGLPTDNIVACGGVPDRSPLLMQLIADTCALPVVVPSSNQVPARGSALFAAVAAGASRRGFDGIAQAAAALKPAVGRTYSPDAGSVAIYEKLYPIWKGVHDTLGRTNVTWLHQLKQLKLGAGGGH